MNAIDIVLNNSLTDTFNGKGERASQCNDALKKIVDMIMLDNGPVDEYHCIVILNILAEHSKLTTTKAFKKGLPPLEKKKLIERRIEELTEVDYDTETIDHLFGMLGLKIQTLVAASPAELIQHLKQRCIAFLDKIIDVLKRILHRIVDIKFTNLSSQVDGITLTKFRADANLKLSMLERSIEARKSYILELAFES